MIYDKIHHITFPDYFGFGFADLSTVSIHDGETHIDYKMDGIVVHKLNVNGKTILQDCYGDQTINETINPSAEEAFRNSLRDLKSSDPRLKHLEDALSEEYGISTILSQQKLPEQITLPAGLFIRFSIPVLANKSDGILAFDEHLASLQGKKLFKEKVTQGYLEDENKPGQKKDVLFHHYTSTLARALENASLLKGYFPGKTELPSMVIAGYGNTPFGLNSWILNNKLSVCFNAAK
ncbi:MAG: hypothetical protein JJU28_19170 [Cyclobacteriaceae bacterium]|nr:hypothetical protein [Cyclobacteriaceae bacterium]